MAKFIPELSDIASWRVKPTEGEWYVLTFLKSFLDDTYEVYFNPYLNEDRPDILIMRQYHGVLIIEVKDWNLNNFTVEKASDNNEKKGNDNWKWFYTPNSSPVRSPISQVRKYHDNLMSFHIKDLFKMQLTDFNYTAIISTMVFFYGTTRKWLFYSSRFCEYLKKYDFFNSTEKKNKYVKYNCVFAQDDLNPEKFSTLLNENWIGKNKASIYFTNKIYDCFKQQLTPTAHMMNDGKCLEYTPQQRQIIYDLKNVGHKYIKKKSETLNAYIRGAYGSGKTTVLAATAVHTYLKLKNKYSDPHILILCYNITLVNWLRDRLSAASDELSHRVFMISNYHRFINSFFWKKNEFFKIPKSIQTDEDLTKYLEDNYYGNYSLIMQLMRNSSYDHHPPEYYQYDAIFIDEVQDYHREWTKILKNCFLIPGGKFYVFGDEKQNIYGTPVQNKQIDVYFGTRAVSRFYLKDCKRSNTVIQNFLYKYQQHFFSSKYEVDNELGKQTEFIFNKSDYLIHYIKLHNNSYYTKLINLFNNIYKFIDNNGRNISPNDITILGDDITFLRELDIIFRYKTGWKTETMFETYEGMFLYWIQQIQHSSDSTKETTKEERYFLKTIASLIPNHQNLPPKDLKTMIVIILTIYALYLIYNSEFYDCLIKKCYDYNINHKHLLNFLSTNLKIYKVILNKIKDKKSSENKKFFYYCRENKKRHFEMNRGSMKISTIHSFKGWESRMVFLLLDQPPQNSESFAELIYAGLTRTQEHLVIVNLGNNEYGEEINKYLKEDS